MGIGCLIQFSDVFARFPCIKNMIYCTTCHVNTCEPNKEGRISHQTLKKSAEDQWQEGVDQWPYVRNSWQHSKKKCWGSMATGCWLSQTLIHRESFTGPSALPESSIWHTLKTATQDALLLKEPIARFARQGSPVDCYHNQEVYS